MLEPERRPFGQDNMLLSDLLVAPFSFSEEAQKPHRIIVPMLHPATHEIDSPLHVDSGHRAGKRGENAGDLFRQLGCKRLVRIQAKQPLVLEGHVIQGPIELLRLVLKRMFVNLVGVLPADVESPVRTEGINDDNLARPLFGVF